MACEWFAVQTHLKKEAQVASALVYKGFEVFLPTLNRKSRRVPFFAGYVFCRCDARYRLPILVTPGVVRMLGVGREPCPIPDEEIESVRKAIHGSVLTEPSFYYRPGQKVEILEGPLTGVIGTLVSVGQGVCLVLSITLLRRSVRVELREKYRLRVLEAPELRRPA